MMKQLSRPMRAALLCLCALMMLMPLSCASPKVGEGDYVEVYETTGTKSKLMKRQSDLIAKPYDEYSMNISVTVDTKDTLQEFHGCGASLTHSSAYLLMQADEETRNTVLQLLFGADGARFSCVRIPIGSCDYTPSNFFTCDDIEANANMPDDKNLTQFSLYRDTDILAVMKLIYEINPDVTVLAVPWSAPAWMKESNSLLGGALKEEYNEVYANYLYKFIEKYDKEGVRVNYISVINEPRASKLSYPHMPMGGYQQSVIIKALGEKLVESGREDVKIMAYEHNYDDADDIVAQLYIDSVLASDAAKYVSGVAFHSYSGTYEESTKFGFDYLRENFPDAERYITEVTEHKEVIDFAANLDYCMESILISPTAEGGSMSLYWNYVLTGRGGPVSGNSAVCYGLITLDKNSDGSYFIFKNAAYYGLSHVSRFCYEIDGEACKVLKTESSNPTKIIATAFARADGKTVVVVENSDTATYEDVDIVVDGYSVTGRLMPQSAATFIF